MLLRSCWALLFLCAAVGFFGWLGLSDPPEELGNPTEVGTPTHIPSEMSTGDERFQAEATRCELAPPDSCHHQEELQERPSGWLRPRLETLIPDGPLRVAQLMEDMAQLMEDVVQQMRSVSSWEAAGLKEEHRVVLSDLHHMQERARDIYSQLESDLALLTQQHQLKEGMEKLQWANQSLGLMLVAMENHLQNLHAILEPTGWSPSLNFTFILHGSCFVLLVTLLVSTSPCAIMFLLLFLISSALGIPTLSTLLVLAVAGWWLVVVARRGAGGPGLVLPQEEPCHQLTSTPDREHEMELLQEELDRMEMSSLQDPLCLEQPPVMAGDTSLGGVSPIPSGWRTKLSSCGVMLEPVLGTGKLWEPKPYNLSTSLASDMSSLSPRSPCQRLTRAGQRCRKKAIPGQDFCHLHTTCGFTMDLSSRF